MLNTILSTIPSGSPVLIPEWDKFKLDLNTRKDIYQSRYMLAPLVYSPGIRLLKELVLNIDINYLLTTKDDYDRYANYINAEVENLKALFDPVYKHTSGISNMFIDKQGSTSTPEFIVGVDIDNPMLNLPLSEGWDSWKDLKPFRIWYHTSTELVTNFYKGQIVFKDELPKYCLSTIDLTILMFKYVKFIEAFKPFESDIDKVDRFLKECVFNDVLSDMYNIWIFNLVKTMSNADSSIDVIFDQLANNDIPSSINNAIEKGLNTLELHKRNNLSLARVLNTDWWLSGNLVDLIRTSNRAIKLPSMRQYLYLKWLKNRGCVSLLTSLNNQQKSNGFKETFNKNLRVKIREYKRSNFLDTISNNELKIYLQNDLNNLEIRIK